MIDTTGAVGAAKAAGVAIGAYSSVREAVQDVKKVDVFYYEKFIYNINFTTY